MAPALHKIENNIVRDAEGVLARLRAEFEQLKLTNPQRAASFEFGFGNASGLLGPDGGPHREAPVKYLINARAHVQKFYQFLPYLKDSRRMFEIGVGPGYLFRLLIDAYGIDMTGCDIELDKTVVYRELRHALAISERVAEFPVKRRQPIPLAANTDTVIAFWTAYNTNWTVSDHQWLLDFYRDNLVDQKLVAIRFNRQGFNNNPAVMDFYEKHAEFPFGGILRDLAAQQRHCDNFCLVRL